ncbi:MAG: GNAT family N-acetyltransferase [Anaerolineae bacterium]|nr:GNAT family N-acetyltransferase [Anaerolineae bacterium]
MSELAKKTRWPVVTLSVDDYEAIIALWQDAGLSIRPTGRDSREQVIWQLANSAQTLLGVRDGDRLIGVVVVTNDGRKGWINRLAVHPAYRRQGVAQCLIEAAEHVLHEQGMQIIAALIEGWNKASLALFEQVGYISAPDVCYVSKRDRSDV